MPENAKSADIEAPTAPSRDRPGGDVALLVIDMINGFDFPDGERLMPKAAAAARSIATLRAQVEARGRAVIYVNDNFGEWHSEKSRLIERALEADRGVLEPILPEQDDYFVIKPQFSGFYATNLPVLLPKLGVSRLILTGIQTDICVLFTAADAHMRDYDLWIPADCVAAADDDRSRWALSIMQSSMGAETRATGTLDVAAWLRCLDRGGA